MCGFPLKSAFSLSYLSITRPAPITRPARSAGLQAGTTCNG